MHLYYLASSLPFCVFTSYELMSVIFAVLLIVRKNGTISVGQLEFTSTDHQSLGLQNSGIQFGVRTSENHAIPGYFRNSERVWHLQKIVHGRLPERLMKIKQCWRPTVSPFHNVSSHGWHRQTCIPNSSMEFVEFFTKPIPKKFWHSVSNHTVF